MKVTQIPKTKFRGEQLYIDDFNIDQVKFMQCLNINMKQRPFSAAKSRYLNFPKIDKVAVKTNMPNPGPNQYTVNRPQSASSAFMSRSGREPQKSLQPGPLDYQNNQKLTQKKISIMKSERFQEFKPKVQINPNVFGMKNQPSKPKIVFSGPRFSFAKEPRFRMNAEEKMKLKQQETYLTKFVHDVRNGFLFKENDRFDD